MYLQKHHEQTQNELAYAVPKAPKRAHQCGFDVTPADGQRRESLHHTKPAPVLALPAEGTDSHQADECSPGNS